MTADDALRGKNALAPSSPHAHAFGQDLRRPGERRTLLVIAVASAMMIVEVAAGLAFGSMALLADGLHMGSHVAALGVNAFAYVYARRRAHDPRFSFGTGKVNALGGFTGALLLAVFALWMVGESVQRLVQPVEIALDQAILVALLGLVVNGASMMILGHGDSGAAPTRQPRAHTHTHPHHHDHNLRSAYLHVLADALTSLLALAALLAAKYSGARWMDPAVGVVGAALVARWSFDLFRSTSAVLLDRQAPAAVVAAVREAIEGSGGARIADLHVWSIGPGIYAVALSLTTEAPLPAESYKRMISPGLGIVHATVEVLGPRGGAGDGGDERVEAGAPPAPPL